MEKGKLRIGQVVATKTQRLINRRGYIVKIIYTTYDDIGVLEEIELTPTREQQSRWRFGFNNDAEAIVKDYLSKRRKDGK